MVEVLYTDECPFWVTLKLTNEVIANLKTDVVIKVRVESEEATKKLKFPSSPTLRRNRVDIDPATTETAGCIGCRIYKCEDSTYELPPK